MMIEKWIKVAQKAQRFFLWGVKHLLWVRTMRIRIKKM